LLPVINRDTRPTALLKDKVARGELGAKTGQGFLKWWPGEWERASADLKASL
jgi:3-hydroxybutyryl-CoA dehydrogenase